MEDKNMADMTWEEFEQFENSNEGRFEFDGNRPIKLMSVSKEHQQISFRVQSIIANYLNNSRCEILSAPVCFVYDWSSLEGGGKQKEPDLMVTCDNNYYKGKYFGVPLLIIEIVSPNNYKEDYNEKRDLYEKIGVQEYWIINHYLRELWIYDLDVESKLYGAPLIFKANEIVQSGLFEELTINLVELFKGLEVREEDLAKFKAKVIKFALR